MANPAVEQINSQYSRFKVQIQFHYNDLAFLATAKEELIQFLKTSLPASTAERIIADILNSTANLKDQVLSLLDQVRLSNLSQTHPDQFGRLQENMAALAEKEKRAAQAKLATKPTIHNLVKTAIAQAVKVNAKLASQEDLLETALMNNPQDALRAVEKIASPTPQEILEFPDLIEAAAALDPAIAITANAITEALPSETPNQAATALTYFKVVNPVILPEQLAQFAHEVEITVTATADQPFDIPSPSITEISAYSPPTTTEGIARELVRIELGSIGVDKTSAADLAQQFTSLGLLNTSYKISQFLPSPSNAPPEVKAEKNRFGFAAVSAAFLENIALQQQPPKKFDPEQIKQWLRQQKEETRPDASPTQKTLQQVLDHIYDLARYQVGQTQLQGSQQKQDSEDRSFGQVLDVLDQAQSIVQDWGPDVYEALVKYFGRYFTSEFGSGAAAAAASGISVASIAPSIVASQTTRFLAMDWWLLMAKTPFLTDAISRGYIAPGMLREGVGGMFRVLNPQAIPFLHQGLLFERGGQFLESAGFFGKAGFIFKDLPVAAVKSLPSLFGGGTAVVATTTGTAATAGATAAAASAPTGPLAVVIGIATAIGTFIATQLPFVKKFLDWLWDKAKGLLRFIFKELPLALGFALGGLGGLLLSLTAGIPAVFAVPAGMAAGGFAQALGHSLVSPTPTAFGSQLGSIASRIATTSLTLIATEIIVPTVIVILAIPPVIALFLFIINSSAFVVPPSASAGLPAPGPGIIAIGTCPIPHGSTGCGSFHSPTARSCHGTDSYWLNAVGSYCKYSIPLDSPNTLNGGRCQYNTYQGESQCYRSSSACSTYGYAADVPPAGADVVVLPKLADANGQPVDREWTRASNLFSINGGTWGYGIFYRTADGLSPSYEMYFGHLGKSSSVPPHGRSGQQIAVLHRGAKFGTHLHIELKQNGVDIIPDPLCQGN